MQIIASATSKYIRMSPKKVRRVVDLIRGKTYSQALYILEYTKRMACGPVWQTLHSAAANATYLQNIAKEDLIIQEIYVNGGPIMKRGRPRAQGRVFQIKKRISHITVKLGRESVDTFDISQLTI